MRICFIRQQQGERVRVYDDAAVVGSRQETWMPLGEQPCPIHTGSICGSMCVRACMLICLGAYGLEAGNRQYAHASMYEQSWPFDRLQAGCSKDVQSPAEANKKWPLCRALLFSPASGSRTISPCMYWSCRSADACGQRYLGREG
ncbi:hypothetical protein J3E69DRAFT_236631 [Trichoderma sp. SZMC 28015]